VEKIIGNHDKILELKSIIKNKKIAHAYLFSGRDGIGKYKIALEFAKSILCQNPTDSYCNLCDSCKTFSINSDLLIVNPEDGIIKVETIRMLNENIYLKPTVSFNKVVIINDADTMNSSAQNALLKTLEEPPSYITIILVASNKEKIINTIKSRCNIINFSDLKLEELKELYYSIQDEKIDDNLFLYSNGSISNLLKLKDSNIIQVVTKMEEAINTNDFLSTIKIFQDIKKIKDIKENFNDILNILISKLGSNLKENTARKVYQIEVLEKTRNRLNFNSNFSISLDLLAIELSK